MEKPELKGGRSQNYSYEPHHEIQLHNLAQSLELFTRRIPGDAQDNVNQDRIYPKSHNVRIYWLVDIEEIVYQHHPTGNGR